MSAETFTTAMFLITAVIAAGVLVNAVFPIVYNMAETFTASSHASDVRLRTDFVIVTSFTSQINTPGVAQIWIKNIGSQPISMADIQKSDVFCGQQGNFGRLTYVTGIPNPGQWAAAIQVVDNNPTYWNPGETLQITANTLGTSYSFGASGTFAYFQFVLPNGIYRSTQFTVSP